MSQSPGSFGLPARAQVYAICPWASRNTILNEKRVALRVWYTLYPMNDLISQPNATGRAFYTKRIYRVGSFIALGLLLIAGAFAYQRVQREVHE